MGGPKKKWTLNEEVALRAGVLKYGAGKWRCILSHRKFGPPLKARSNVDLKDKWRNIATATFGSRRKRAKISIQNQDDDDDNDTDLAIVAVANDGGQQIVPASPANGADEGLFTSVDAYILEAITSLTKRLGPTKKSISRHVEEKNMQRGKRRLVASRLKHLVNVGTIITKNNRYKISPNYAAAEAEQSSPQLLLEGNKPEENGVENHTESQVDGEAFKINGMTEEEASAAAAIALEEAEFARAEAEDAAKEAERAEAEAEAMQDFAAAINEVWNHLLVLHKTE